MRALIYTRQSTDDQDTTQASQTHECRLWAEANGYEIAASFHDEISGSSKAWTRDGFTAMLKEIKDGDTIISKRRDRLGRDAFLTKQAEKMIEALGATFRTPDSLDPTSIIGKLTNSIQDATAEYELDLIRERTRSALAELRRQGKPSGTPTLGTKIIYRTTTQNGEEITTGELAPDLNEVDKINLVREWRSQGATYEQLRQRCEDNGLTSRRGCTPSLRTLHSWCKGITKPKAKATTKEGPVPARRIEARAENKGLSALVTSLKAQGMSLRKIAAKVTAEGYTTSKGGPITKTQIMRILANA